jgi:hypothetical protein
MAGLEQGTIGGIFKGAVFVHMAFVLYGIYQTCATLAGIRLYITCHGDDRLTVKGLSHNATWSTTRD